MLFDGLEAAVVELIVTVFVVDVPATRADATLNVNWNDALAPAAKEGIVQTTGPVPLQANAGPAV